MNVPALRPTLFPANLPSEASDSIIELHYSRDGNLMAWRGKDGCQLFNTQTGELHSFSNADDIAIAPSGRWLAVYVSNVLELIDLQSDEKFTIEGEYVGLNDLTLNAAGTLLVGVADPNKMYIWDTRQRRLIDEFAAHQQGIRGLAFSPTSENLLASSSKGIIYMWDLFSRIQSARSHEPTRTLKGHAENVYSVAFSRDGKLLASSGGDDMIMLLWDVESGNILQRYRGHNSGVDSVAISHDAQLIASGSRDKTVRLWDVNTGNELVRFADHMYEVKCVVFTPDGTQLISCDESGAFRIRNLQAAVEATATREEVESATGLFLDGETVRPIPKRFEWWTEER
jgi:WD40 repeat protein